MGAPAPPHDPLQATEAQHGEQLQVPRARVWQEVPVEARHEAARENSHGGQALGVQRVSEEVHHQAGAAAPRGGAHGEEAFPVRGVRQQVHPAGQPEDPREEETQLQRGE